MSKLFDYYSDPITKDNHMEVLEWWYYETFKTKVMEKYHLSVWMEVVRVVPKWWSDIKCSSFDDIIEYHFHLNDDPSIPADKIIGKYERETLSVEEINDLPF